MSTATKERPILFSGEMVRAILAGRKTQTRRIIKGRGTWSVEEADDFSSRKWPGYEDEYGTWTDMECPYGYPTDRLWVRETCRAEELPDGTDGVRYLADKSFNVIENTLQASGDWVALNHYRTGRGGIKGQVVPAIHMPRWASRITLEITGVRVEQLNDISEEEAKAEGCPCDETPDGTCSYWFRDLWESINGVGSWAKNPFVWVIEFERVKQLVSKEFRKGMSWLQ